MIGMIVTNYKYGKKVFKKNFFDNFYFRPELETLICDSEPFWQLAHFGKLGVDKNNVKSNLLQDLKNNVKPNLFSIKKKLVSLLTASCRPGAYEQSYSYIMK